MKNNKGRIVWNKAFRQTLYSFRLLLKDLITFPYMQMNFLQPDSHSFQHYMHFEGTPLYADNCNGHPFIVFVGR
jgi:hypothetical protein